MSNLQESESFHIREVWRDNIEAEFRIIEEFIDVYPYVSMDTEYPGVVQRLIGNCKSHYEYNYQSLKVNVNLLKKIIQIGLTFSDEKGNLPKCGTDKYCVWQFNFCEFNPDEDVYAKESINLLSQSGIDFERHREHGVEVNRFIELLKSSGAVLNDDMCWVTFHGGYDFGYLIKLLIAKDLPDTQEDFLKLIKTFFPVHYDVKNMMTFYYGLRCGLNNLVNQLGVKRVGTSHQAGSDSLLTSCIFMKMKEKYLKGSLEKHAGVLFGLQI